MKARLAILLAAGCAALACATAIPRRDADTRPAVTTVTAAPAPQDDARDASADLLHGEPHRKTQGDLTVFVPADVAVKGGSFDLVVHFHGVSKLQEKNVEEADLHAVVVSVNEGMGSSSYGRTFAPERSLDRVISFAEKEAAASGRIPGEPHVRRIALSAWSAGGAAVSRILQKDEARIDAVLIADGIFSSYAEPAKHVVDTKPLEPFTQFARVATEGKKLFVLTHSDIDPSDYPSVKECTDAILGELGVPKAAAPPSANPAEAPPPTYAADRGDLHVRGYEGKGKQDHIDQIKLLDDAYAKLRERWSR